MVYIVRMLGTNYYKIGYTSHDTVQSRIKSLQTSCPLQLEVIRIIDGNTTVESKLHKFFESYRKNGGKDWFELEEEQVNNIPLSKLFNCSLKTLKYVEPHKDASEAKKKINLKEYCKKIDLKDSKQLDYAYERIFDYPP